MSKEMSVKKDLKCVFNMPKKIQSEFSSEEEMAHSLPPYEPMDVYSVDEYDACPTEWMNGSDITSSYFVGAKEDYGMWLDFNECFYHTHDVAIVISIQGINPITGQTMVKEKALQLEQYHKKCPIHKTEFKQDRFCEKCGFKWAGQNYLSTTGTPEMKLWLDGFRSSDGKVRQYIITEDKIRSVAAEIMKKRGEDPENRVFAIGIAYYLSKHKKPYTLERPQEGTVGSHTPSYMHQGSPMFFSPCHSAGNWNIKGVGDSNITSGGFITSSGSSTKGVFKSKGAKKYGSSSMRASASVNDQLQSTASDPDLTITTHHTFQHKPDVIDGRIDRTVYQLGPEVSDEDRAIIENSPFQVERFYTLNSDKGLEAKIKALKTKTVETQSVKPVVPVKKLEIGAGALIKQRVYDDPKMIDYWEKEPAGMIYINYCDEATKKKIIDGGRRADEKDGFLKDVKVGG